MNFTKLSWGASVCKANIQFNCTAGDPCGSSRTPLVIDSLRAFSASSVQHDAKCLRDGALFLRCHVTSLPTSRVAMISVFQLWFPWLVLRRCSTSPSLRRVQVPRATKVTRTALQKAAVPHSCAGVYVRGFGKLVSLDFMPPVSRCP